MVRVLDFGVVRLAERVDAIHEGRMTVMDVFWMTVIWTVLPQAREAQTPSRNP